MLYNNNVTNRGTKTQRSKHKMKKSTWSKDGVLKFGDFDANYTFKGFSPEQFHKYSNQYAYDEYYSL